MQQMRLEPRSCLERLPTEGHRQLTIVAVSEHTYDHGMDDNTDLGASSSPASGGEYPTFLLDFLYVDVARVRSLLAQLAGGVASTASDTLEEVRARIAEASLPIARGGRTATSSSRSETTRTLGDLIVPVFEEEAAAAGYLVDVSGELTEPTEWHSGAVHERLPVGTILRHTGQTRLLDPVHVSELIEHFEGTASAVDRMAGGSQGGSAGKGGRTTPKGGSPAKTAQLRGMKKMTEPIRELVENLLAGGISLRVFPCGTQHPDCGFGGLLLDRSDYIEPERGALFARHGVLVSDWTVVALVNRHSAHGTTPEFGEFDPSEMIRQSGAINRQAIERLVLQLLGMLEGVGMSEGPSWPSIGITPLAVYRTIERPKSSDA